MVAFHMFCHEDARRARAMARPPFEEYFRALTESVGDWACGTTSKDYRDYDTSMRRLRSFTLDSQIASGGAWVGTPDEIKAMIARVVESIGQIRACLPADQFRHAPFAKHKNRCGCSRARCCRHLPSGEVCASALPRVQAARVGRQDCVTRLDEPCPCY